MNLKNQYNNYLLGIDDIKEGETIIIYGAGATGSLILSKINNTKNIFFCDQNYDIIKIFENYPVISPEELISKYKNSKIFLCTSTFNQQITNFLIENGVDKKNIIDGLIFDHENQYFDPVINFDNNEVFLDVGGYDGVTSVIFAKNTNYNYKKIYLFEPDKRNLEKIKKLKLIKNFNNVEILEYGAWDKKETLSFDLNTPGCGNINNNGTIEINCDSIDNLIDDTVTFIKMDIEGAELNALIGAEQTIRKNKPKLAISIYHKPDDIITIQSYIKSIVPEYKIYLRHYSTYSCETVLYAVL